MVTPVRPSRNWGSGTSYNVCDLQQSMCCSFVAVVPALAAALHCRYRQDVIRMGLCGGLRSNALAVLAGSVPNPHQCDVL